ncbi:MAG: serine/threonine-protein kinase [Gemmataceae bacterium]
MTQHLCRFLLVSFFFFLASDSHVLRHWCATFVSRGSVLTGEHHSASPVVSATEPFPKAIGRLEILSLLGEGSFGRVYRARDPKLDRDVALKVPRPGTLATEADRERFLREARAAATVQHPNLCPVYEVGQDGDHDYIVMAYVAGQSLAALLKARKEPLPARQSVQIVRRLAQALDAAHKKGVVHRDLKPANILFDPGRKEVVVTDFGLALRAGAGDAELIGSGIILGTPAYMAPEQARGDAKSVGPTADIYSLGVILYELLTGRRPFGGSVGEVIGQILHVEPEPPSKVRPGVDPQLEAACLKAMAKDPAQRYGSMKELASALAAPPPGPAVLATSSIQTREEPPAEELLDVHQLFAALTNERQQTAAAVEAAVRKARTPPWMITLIGLITVGGLAVLGGIIFFTRTEKVKVTIELTDVNLSDKSLGYFLNDEPIPAESLNNPTELKPGEHVLVVKRGQEIVKRFLLTVTGGRSPGIKVTEITPPPQTGPQPAQSTGDAERDLARWFLQNSVHVAVIPGDRPGTHEQIETAGVRWITQSADLPTEPFKLYAVWPLGPPT